MKRLTKKIKRQVITIKKLLITILIYNNFDYAKDRRSKKIDEMRQFKSIIITLLFEFYKFDLISLRKDI